MAIRFDEENRVFHLDTPNTTYIFGIHKKDVPVHIYYGKKISSDFSFSDVFIEDLYSFSPFQDLVSFTDTPMEYSYFGGTDLRQPSFHARHADGSTLSCFTYTGYSVVAGKPKLEGLPSSYVENEWEADTLLVDFEDKFAGLKITLSYTVYNDRDIITRSVKVTNVGSNKAELLRVMSMSMDFLGGDSYDIIHLEGNWARERHVERRDTMHGSMSIGSRRGASSHFHNPFLCLAKKETTEFSGEAYGFGLVYSGNFTAGMEMNAEELMRIYVGINDFDFCWSLNPGETFQAPEVVMTYSDKGFNKMSQNFHSFVKKRICRGKFRDTARPVLINNWEATYFNFNEDKIVDIATTAKDLGVELMVLDDGWFGKRNDDNCSLGDWYPNLEKLPNGIGSLAKKINDLGMLFGIWIEPEMVSPDSDLYHAHPDWIVGIKGRKSSLGRFQYVLDVSRPDVQNFIIETVSSILSENPVSYIKWDMNRNISEPGSFLLPPQQQQEFAHRYMLGLYRVLEVLIQKFPDVLFEGCAGGGGRFDLGMLHYFPQIWTSDDSDAVERMHIQYGTSYLYPSGVMGAHVSAVPNHQVQRVTPIETRGNIAMMGRFGYELDLALLTEEEKEIVREQIVTYKKWGEVIHNGTMYRLESPFNSNHFVVEFVSEDQKHVIVIYATILKKANTYPDRLKLMGLDSASQYREIHTDKTYGGDVLEQIGIQFRCQGDFTSKMLIFEKL